MPIALACPCCPSQSVIDDLVWLLRHGDSYGQGVACAALSQYQREEQRQWLAAVAAIPAVQLLSSPSDYARHSAARLLAVLARVQPHLPEVLCVAGAVPGLLAQLDLARTFPYTRCSGGSGGEGGGGARAWGVALQAVCQAWAVCAAPAVAALLKLRPVAKCAHAEWF
jgi:hypothetical protein